MSKGHRKFTVRNCGMLLLAIFIAGCSQGDARPAAEFSGKVTFDGVPMEEGSIHFTSPKTGESTFCNIEKEGAYRVLFQDADVGEVYEISVQEAVVNQPDTPAHEMKPPPKLTVNLPRKYKARATSGLTATLAKPGVNLTDVALTSK